MPNTRQTTIIELAKQLIAIPSYVDTGHDESELVEFLYRFFRDNLPAIQLEKHYIDNSSRRSNLIGRGKNRPKLLVLGHIDTVRPKANWLTPATTPTVKDGKLYGLGAADMKGSLAAFLWALIDSNVALDDLMILLYCDEEYDFAGIKQFLKTEELVNNPPELILSLDGSLELASGCRGLIEFDARITGRSGHASNPSNGVNAITNTVRAVSALEQAIAAYSDEFLGPSTLNLAYLRGGTVEQKSDDIIWQREGNVIPDYADITLEFRTAQTPLNADEAIRCLQAACKQHNLLVEVTNVRHDLAPWPVVSNSALTAMFKDCYQSAKIEFRESDRTFSGFIDTQMIVSKINTPAYILGTGGNNKHGANENVPLDNLSNAYELYKSILKRTIGAKK